LADKISPLRLGCRVSFADRWQGRVSGLEVDEDWTVYNISVSTGLLFASRTVRLPFTSVSSWSDDSVQINVSSFQAFAREIPPVAVPARPLDSSTPLSHPGSRFAGLIISQTDRRAAEVIISRGVAGLYRTRVSEVSFTGKTMTIAVQQEQLVRYYSDAEIHKEVHRLISRDRALPTDDKRHLHADVEEGVVTLAGNVRVANTRDYAGLIASHAHGVVSVRNELHDDFEIEAVIGMALNESGLNHTGRVYVRSNLGEVLVDGTEGSQRAAEDVVRAVARVPGVRAVVNRLRISAATPVG
jgi:osmotically-inducible protein OsmY